MASGAIRYAITPYAGYGLIYEADQPPGVAPTDAAFSKRLGSMLILCMLVGYCCSDPRVSIATSIQDMLSNDLHADA